MKQCLHSSSCPQSYRQLVLHPQPYTVPSPDCTKPINLLVAEFIIAVQAQQDNCRGREDLKKFDQDSKREMHQQGEKARARMSSVFPWHYQQA